MSDDWRPIETAPRDEPLLLFGPLLREVDGLVLEGSFVCSGYWDEVDGAWCSTLSTFEGPFLAPTHWMPVPESPSTDRSSG